MKRGQRAHFLLPAIWAGVVTTVQQFLAAQHTGAALTNGAGAPPFCLSVCARARVCFLWLSLHPSLRLVSGVFGGISGASSLSAASGGASVGASAGASAATGSAPVMSSYSWPQQVCNELFLSRYVCAHARAGVRVCVCVCVRACVCACACDTRPGCLQGAQSSLSQSVSQTSQSVSM